MQFLPILYTGNKTGESWIMCPLLKDWNSDSKFILSMDKIAFARQKNL